MDISAIVRRACPGYGEIAAKAGLSHTYLRQLVKPSAPRSAGYEARHRLARALREQARQMLVDAETLEAAD